MIDTRWMRPLIVGLVLVAGAHGSTSAQVIEQREGEANPGAVIFRTTAFGAGTGLMVGGAYALVEDDDDLSTGEILKWSVAGGTAAGLVIGIVHLMVRPGPQGEAEEVGMNRSLDHAPRLQMPSVAWSGERDLLGNRHHAIDMSLVNVSF